MIAYFVVLGITNGDWLARIPALAHGLHLSDGMLGLALLAGPAGSFAVASIAGAFIDRTGSRTPTMAGGAAVALLPVSFGVASSQPALMAGMLAFGIAVGVLDVSMNAQAVQVEQARGRPLMTSFHACYSFGALAGGLIGGAFAWAGVRPAIDFAAVAVPLAVLAILARAWLMPNPESGPLAAAGRPQQAPVTVTTPGSAGGVTSEPAGSDGPDGPEAGSAARPLRRVSPLLVLSLLAFCSLLGEGAADGWSAVYLRDNVGTSAGFAALGFAAFALTMASGRLAGDRLAARFGSMAILRAGGLMAAAGMAVVLITASPPGAVAGFAIYGAGLSCTFPQLITLAGQARPGRPAGAIGIVMGVGYMGLLCGPVLIGGLASAAGLATALILPVALALVIALGAIWAAPRASR
ncbi:MAG TPA: MFS transporter [Streptosporangiaceae bacterium]